MERSITLSWFLPEKIENLLFLTILTPNPGKTDEKMIAKTFLAVIILVLAVNKNGVAVNIFALAVNKIRLAVNIFGLAVNYAA